MPMQPLLHGCGERASVWFQKRAENSLNDGKKIQKLEFVDFWTKQLTLKLSFKLFLKETNVLKLNVYTQLKSDL